MKKQIIKLLAVVAVVAVAGWNYMHSENRGYYSDLALENIEALAEDEWEDDLYHKFYCGGNNNYYKCTVVSGESCEGPNPPYPC